MKVRVYAETRGFILGVVLLLSLLMAAFIFSYNSIVRSRNLQAHHYMASEVVSNLAVSGVKILSENIKISFEDAIKKDCPELFEKTAEDISQPIILDSSSEFCAGAKVDFQKFLDSISELKESGVLTGGTPVCEVMEVSIDNITSLAPSTDGNQFQLGRDPIEKCGLMNLTCVVRHFGLARKASISHQFRVVSMVPGPFARFTLFIGKTPYPDSYNAMGVKFDGKVDTTYPHPPAGNITFTGPLTVFNGTDTETIKNNVSFKDADIDATNLRERGWIYIGASGPTKRGSVNIKIPSGFDSETGGQFMFGWPSKSSPTSLAPALLEKTGDFLTSDPIPDLDYILGSKYHGFYTSEEGNPEGAGEKNLWPGLATGDLYKPSDRYLSASTWLFPFGNMEKSSRTLVIGPVLAGYLKYFFIKGSGVSGTYKGLFGSLPSDTFAEKQSSNPPLGSPLRNYCYFWGGMMRPVVHGMEFFIRDYESFKLLMPHNSLPSTETSSRGVAFNIIFDFMKYSRSKYPKPADGPTLCHNEYFNKEYLVPMAENMQVTPVKGVHRSGDMGIFFHENGEYNPNVYPDNCFFHGDLADLTVEKSNLFSNRITNIIDLKDCEDNEEETKLVESLVFKEMKISGKIYSVPQKSGVFLIRRRADIENTFDDALVLTKREIRLTMPLIIMVDTGSVNIEADIKSELKDDSPEQLCTIALLDGDIYISGSGNTRTIHAYLAMVGERNRGRLLRSPSGMMGSPSRFDIFGGLAVTELGLYIDKNSDPRSEVGSTMLSFKDGGTITYNSRFNPGLSHYDNSRILALESVAGELEISGVR